MYNAPPPSYDCNSLNHFGYNLPYAKSLVELMNSINVEISRKEAEYAAALNNDRPFSELKELRNQLNHLYQKLTEISQGGEIN